MIRGHLRRHLRSGLRLRLRLKVRLKVRLRLRRKFPQLSRRIITDHRQRSVLGRQPGWVVSGPFDVGFVVDVCPFWVVFVGLDVGGYGCHELLSGVLV